MSLSASLVRADRSLARDLFRLKEDEALRSALIDVVANGQGVLAVTEWRTLQRTLNQGSCEPEGGSMPLNQCLLGGRQLHRGPEYSISLVRPDLIPHLDQELQALEREQFRERLAAFGGDDAADEPALWNQLQAIRDFYHACAENGDSAVFVAPLA